MTHEETTTLINQFKELHLQAKDIHKKQQEIINRLEATHQASVQQQPTLIPVREERLSPIVTVPQVSPRATTLSEELRIDQYKKGDRVRIINKVRKPAGRGQVETKDRTGKVIGRDLITERVYILTDNGTKTWRLPKNIRRIIEITFEL